MDPPMLVNENSFPSTNGAPCNFSEIWQVPINGRLESSHFSGEAALSANQDFSASDLLGNSARRRRDAVMEEEEEADRAASTSNANPMNDNVNKRLKTLGSGGKNQHTKEESEDGKGANQGSKLQPEPPKDYIHVRARRGQATDSHSLAERARREKISDRMNTLQDLVPGCNKVIGKAMVLDEIINYVQSLQQQVEFLSMKLEAVNSRMNVGLEGYPLKNFGQVRFDPSVADYSPQAPKNT